MKTRFSKLGRSVAILATALISSRGAEVAAPVVIERGPHHRVVRNIQAAQAGDRLMQRHSDIVELESGMHRWDGQAWVETSPQVRVVNGSGVANLLYSVEFAPNLATRGAVKITLPDGNRLTMHVLGVAYVDGPNSVLIAEVKDCIGEIGGPEQNEVTYRDAFTDFPIDCKFIVRKGSLSQHIRIRSALPPPTDYGLSEHAFLEVFTEAIEFPEGTAQTRRWRAAQGDQGEILDERISFGPMEFVTGKAFFADESALRGEIPVFKTWSSIEGRTFLRERLPFTQIKDEIAKLPMAAGAAKARKEVKRLAGGFLPAVKTAGPAGKAIEIAASGREANAYVVDYELVASADNFTWKCDSTYYIAGAVSIKTNAFEGGVVIKLAPTNNAKLTITGPVTNHASQYRPVTFTARDDHTIGEVIGTNAVSGYYGVKALELDWYTAGATFNLEHFRFRYAQVGVHFNGGLGNALSHAQFVRCSNAVEQTSSDVSLRNVLIHKANNALVGNSGSTNRGEHLTLHEVVNHHSSGNPVLFLTNTLLVALTNAGTYSGLSNQTASAVGAGFQIVGGGHHYLTNNSVWRDAGTPNINAGLLSHLSRSTTYAPTVRSNELVSSDTLLTPQVTRDTGSPDLGYHYAPLDYALTAFFVSNCVLTITNGVSIAAFGGTAILLQRNAELVAKGLATDLVHFGPYDAVQEQPIQWATEDGGGLAVINTFWTNGVAPKVQLRFAAFDSPPGSFTTFHLYTDDSPNRGYTNISVRDCQFAGGDVYLWEISGGKYAFTNVVCERVNIQVVDPVTFVIANSNFRGGSGWFSQANSNGLWQFKNSLVDTSSIVWSSACLREYNAFHQSPDFYSIQNTNATEIVLTNLVYETGRFGRWYQPTNSPLINAGSETNSASVGFYWYTATTNHVIEGNSHLDIGYHSVGVDSNTGEPWDTNGDGVPNYLQDVNGNGVTEPNELPGLKMWLKADAGVTNEPTGVSGWADQSGNNNHGRQTVTNKQPAYLGAALNGKPILRFNSGKQDHLKLPTTVTNGLAQADALIVLKAASDSPSGTKALWKFGLNNGAYPDTGGVVKDSFARVNTKPVGKPSISLTQYHTYDVASRSNQWAARINGILYYQDNILDTNRFPTDPQLGSDSTWYFDGDIAEVFMFGRVLSDFDRDELATYLNQRYALVSLPPTISGLRAIAISSNQVSLSWTNALPTTAIRTIVERRTTLGAYAQVALVRNTTSHIDSGLTAGTSYFYRLKNANAAGESAYSTDASTTTSNSTIELPLANLRTWLKADAGITGTNVSFWEDQSGYYNHASQADNGKQPESVPLALRAKPITRYNGLAQYLAFTNFSRITNSLSEAQAVVLVRASAEMPSTTRTLWLFGDNDGRYPDTDGLIVDGFGRQGSAIKSTGSGMTLDVFSLYEVSTKSGEFIARWNDFVVLQTNNNTVVFRSVPYLGTSGTSGPWFAGDIAEFQIYNRVLTAAERATVRFYLKDKYGLLDTDGDGLFDKDELAQGTNPNEADTNGDGLSDWEDIQAGISPTNNDIDGDGLANAAEILIGTSPFDPDTDRDTFNDKDDLFPLDPTRWSFPGQTNDITAPVIILLEPTNATPL